MASEKSSETFFLATPHQEFLDQDLPRGSTIIDPWRLMPWKDGVEIHAIGRNRPEMISLLCPSRARSKWFSRMARSAIATSTYPRQVEIICYLDEDDPELSVYKAPNTTFISGPRILLSETWNRCFEVGAGNIFMHCGDDVIFRTEGWDQIVRTEFAQSEDKILFIHGDDKGPNGEVFGTHGFLHRRWAETIGYFVPPLFSSDWNDVWLNEVANEIDRRVLIPIVTEHMHYTFGKSERDDTYRQREERGDRDGVVALYKRTKKERARDVQRLRRVMV